MDKNLDIYPNNKKKKQSRRFGFQVEHWGQDSVLSVTFLGMSFTSLGLSFCHW